MPERATAEPLRFAYWVPNVSGGLVTSTIEQPTDWGDEYSKELAERAGFNYALNQVRYMASYGAEYPLKARAANVALEITSSGEDP
jgi:FMNH2-dependent dimethyl sulfone monooxygenase